MKSKLKRTFFTAIDYLPEGLGFDLYHAIQKMMTGSFHSKLEANKKTFEKAKLLLNDFGGLDEKSILEIGSGWMPIMPYFLKYLGKVDRVFTYDINEHYDNAYIDQLNEIFRNDYRVVFENLTGKYQLPEFIEYFPKSNVIATILPKKVDIIFSRFVLEHITPDDLFAMHKRFNREYDENTLIMHFISPSDHRAYSDKSISHYDFLKYSEKEWNKIQTKFDYHNRLRLPQYLDVFDTTGFEVLHLEYDKVEKYSDKYRMFKELNINDDFKQFSEEELLAGSINVLLRKKSI